MMSLAYQQTDWPIERNSQTLTGKLTGQLHSVLSSQQMADETSSAHLGKQTFRAMRVNLGSTQSYAVKKLMMGLRKLNQ